ncbi:hypothetical protein SD427_04320 [Chryseobacterium sp. JJR-5R]|uniref:hypothetical protein n=1 Tax=Chryseobacterium sp. JJR-5R TaxID=3093923 RepID=UPI002A75895C|nr:hypothetical protein [Chryseobacterium sp. JJR-5R]WPO83567.1 hypothetical protein SD427_04320 [Chryseobacterium sp. JJR-5R]
MKLKKSYRYSKRILSILLLFLFFKIFSQRISVENKHIYPLEIRYKNQVLKLGKGEKKVFADKEIDFLNIEFDNGRKIISKDIPILLNPNESLNINVLNSIDQTLEFKGDKAPLHNLVINQQHYILYKNIGNYQDILSKNTNTQQLISYFEFVLADYLTKIKTLNASPTGTEDKIYRRAEKYAINDWVASLYLILTGQKTLDLQKKELILYYYNKYIKKDFPNYHCGYKVQYNIIRDLIPYTHQLNINFPEYSVIENTDEDRIIQHLPESCQRFYFKNNYNYFYEINSPKKEYYKGVLKEKFNN